MEYYQGNVKIIAELDLILLHNNTIHNKERDVVIRKINR